MVKITEELVRKKSEHNELLISTLEELSLHQENIEKIEHINNWCRDLKILLLQSNLIAKIENLNKLKKLKYLNLAINNIEQVQNLEGLESLQKLDLTLNFIGTLTSVERLRENYHLEELFLTGNPCADFEGYRDYVISVLPQLKALDGTEITRTDRLKALKSIEENRRKIIQLQTQYQIFRDEQKVRVENEIKELENVDLDDEEKLKEFWNKTSEHCPEIRTEIAMKSRKAKEGNAGKIEYCKKEEFEPRLFADCGRPYNLNIPKLKFKFLDELDRYELDLFVYKHLNTSLLNVDLQPNYIRITVKGKIFQLALNEEVAIEKSTSQRIMTTGNLLVIMPKLNFKKVVVTKKDYTVKKESKEQKGLKGTVDIKSIVSQQQKDEIFDESEVPPLI